MITSIKHWNKTIRFLLMALLVTGILSACGKLDTIPYYPPQTPQSWLTIQPYAHFSLNGQDVFLMQPSTTFWVYLLGIQTIALGIYFLRIRGNQRSRLW